MAAAAGEGRDRSATYCLTLRVVWSPSALREVKRVFDYLRHFNPQAAAEVAAALVAAGDSLAEFPGRGRPLPGTDKREVVTVYPYIIRYQVAGGGIRILRVRHTSRRPTKV